MNSPLRISARAVALWLLAACALSLALPACSRRHMALNPDVNRRPTASIGADRTAGPAPLTVHFTSAALDPEGGPLTYDWGFGDGGVDTTRNPQHTYAANGQYTVELQVTDDQGAFAHDEKLIRVGGTNHAPTVNAGADQLNKDPGTQVNLTGTATDPDGQPVTTQWSQVGGPAVTIVNATALAAHLTTPASQTNTFIFRLTAQDDAQPPASASDDITVTTRVTWNNTAAGLFQVHAVNSTQYGCVKSGCHDGNTSGVPNWGVYATVAADSTNLVTRLSAGGNMRGYAGPGEADLIIAWLHNGAPLLNP